MNRRPLYFITREKEWELIQKLKTIVNSSDFHPDNTVVIMASPDYSATITMHLAHSWSRDGKILSIIPVDVTYPGESSKPYIDKFISQKKEISKYSNIVVVEAGIIRGGNWTWILDTLINVFDYKREQITLVAACENIHSAVKSDYVAEYYNDEKEELMFYYEKYNKNWPVK